MYVLGMKQQRTGCHVIHMVLCARRSTHYETVFLLSKYLSQVERGSACSVASVEQVVDVPVLWFMRKS